MGRKDAIQYGALILAGYIGLYNKAMNQPLKSMAWDAQTARPPYGAD
jgi:hypothetical protein